MLRKTLLILLCLIALNQETKAQTTKTSIGGQTVTQYAGGYQDYSVPSYGLVRKYYDNGAWRYSVNGMELDYGYFGSLKTLTSSDTFDLGKIGQFGRKETDQKFAVIWQTFRESHTLSPQGRFVPTNNANTPANKLALYEFAHYVSEARPAITISAMVKCDRCSGKRRRTGLTPTGAVGEVPCEDCNAFGSIAKVENYALIITGALPERPKLEDFIREKLIATQAPAPAPAPAPALRVTTAPAPKQPEAVGRDLTPEERFSSAKAKAEAGDSQAQYELGLFYSHDYERAVPLDYFEAFSWTYRASQKNHRMAQRLLAKLYEQGRGTDKNLQEAIKWYRISALLGCKQSQRWMGQMYYTTFQGSVTYDEFVKKDISNLTEAYAWFLMGADKTLPLRTDPKVATQEELSFGPKLLHRDYTFEISAQGTSGLERDNVAKNTSFTRQTLESGKARFSILQSEATDYRRDNKVR
jgi:hypothetical protein